MISEYPDFDVLVNNAGIQRQGRFASDAADWPTRQREIAINLEAPLHLAALVLDQFRARPRAAIINVSSGFAFVAAPIAPVYGATKAALHSFTTTLRAELEDTPIEVAEIVPPVVNTDLGGPGLHDHGVSSEEFAGSVMGRIAAGELEVGYGFSEALRHATREELDGQLRPDGTGDEAGRGLVGRPSRKGSPHEHRHYEGEGYGRRHTPQSKLHCMHSIRERQPPHAPALQVLRLVERERLHANPLTNAAFAAASFPNYP